MSKEQNFTAEQYKRMVKSITDVVWGLLDEEELTPYDADRLINAAYAARFHQGEFGEPLDIARSEWHLARANLKVKRFIPALYHGQKCLEVCREGDLGPFTIAYAYEALARTAAELVDKDALEEYLILATRYGKMIEDEDEKKMFFADLATVPGYKG